MSLRAVPERSRARRSDRGGEALQAKADSPWRLFRPWHLMPLLLIVLVLGGSVALGDPRPLLVVFWWMGILGIILGIVAGLIAGVVVLLVGIRRQLVSGRNREGKGDGA